MDVYLNGRRGLFLFLAVTFQGLVAIEEIESEERLFRSMVFIKEDGLDKFIHTVAHFVCVYGHVSIVLDGEGGRVSDTVLMIAIGIKP